MGFLVISEPISQISKEMVLVFKEGTWNYLHLCTQQHPNFQPSKDEES
jgi:hypothetical protein